MQWLAAWSGTHFISFLAAFALLDFATVWYRDMNSNPVAIATGLKMLSAPQLAFACLVLHPAQQSFKSTNSKHPSALA